MSILKIQTENNKMASWAWWSTPLDPALRRQISCEFQYSLISKESSRPSRATQQNPKPIQCIEKIKTTHNSI